MCVRTSIPDDDLKSGTKKKSGERMTKIQAEDTIGQETIGCLKPY